MSVTIYTVAREYGLNVSNINCGLPPGYFREKLTWLLAEIDSAIAHGEPLHFA